MGTNIRIKEGYNFQLWIAGGVLLAGFFAAYAITVSAQADLSKISYPVKELGNCASEQECRDFCNDGDNLISCVNFAERNDLMTPEEAAEARKFARLGGQGPGGCTDKVKCIEYCEDVAHIDECVAFAEENGFIDEGELAEAKKVSAALKGGAKLPGGCRGKAQCETYCNDLDNIKECLDFAEKSGFLDESELAEARQAAKAMESGARPPGGCKNKKECDNYCSDPNNIEECFAFAEKAGFIPEEELEMARKAIPLMKAGKSPGGCKNKEQCESYCNGDAHLEECVNFAVEAGFMSPEDVEMFRKTGGKGPGGCKGRDECEDFCNDEANQETCFNFAKEHGILSEEDNERMQEGREQINDALESATPEVLSCLESKIGADKLTKIRSGQAMPSQQIGNVMRSCFEESMMPPGGEDGGRGGENFGPPEGISPEDFERFKQEGGFPSGEGGGFPSEEEMMEKFQNGEFNQGGFEFEDGRQPSPEEIQGIIQQRTQEIIQQKTQEQMERFGGPSGGGDFGPGPSEFQGQLPSGGFEQFGPSGTEGGSQQQFSPLPSGGSGVPSPTSSVWQVVLFPLLDLLER